MTAAAIAIRRLRERRHADLAEPAQRGRRHAGVATGSCAGAGALILTALTIDYGALLRPGELLPATVLIAAALLITTARVRR